MSAQDDIRVSRLSKEFFFPGKKSDDPGNSAGGDEMML
jgi:hypothetical protein